MRETFGRNLRRIRCEHAMPQAELARRAGVTIGCISQYENGKRLPNLEMAAKIAAGLDVGIDDLISTDEPFLAPCPFCGAHGEIIADKKAHWGVVRHAEGCFFLCDGLPIRTQHIPVHEFESWNRRAR